MNKILQLSSLALCVSFVLYSGCAGNDEPKPLDCADSDLAITLAANGDTDPTTCSSNDGSIQVEASGGKAPYKFSIGTNPFGSASLFPGLGAGTFKISVQDANACSKDMNVTLLALGAPTITNLSQTEDTNCITPGNGTLTVVATGGTGTYEYKLDNGPFVANPLFENVASGSHTITVRDEESCTVTANASVSKGITGVDYVTDILPIFQAKCNFVGCHPDNGDWFTYSVAKGKAAEIKSRTASGSMPKGGSDAPGGALTATQKALIACWVNDGAPQN